MEFCRSRSFTLNISLPLLILSVLLVPFTAVATEVEPSQDVDKLPVSLPTQLTPEPSGCCFSVGYGSMMKPVSLTSKPVSNRHACAIRRRVGGATGYCAGSCPETAEEAAALLKAVDSQQDASQGSVNTGSPAKTWLALIGGAGALGAMTFIVKVAHRQDDPIDVDEGKFIRLLAE